MEFHCNNNVGNPLGKGEVVSSILTGSTEYARQIEAFRKSPDPRPAGPYATEHEHDGSSRGKSVESVRRAFAAWIDRRSASGWKNAAEHAAAEDVMLGLDVYVVNGDLPPVFRRGLAGSVAALKLALLRRQS